MNKPVNKRGKRFNKLLKSLNKQNKYNSKGWYIKLARIFEKYKEYPPKISQSYLSYKHFIYSRK